MSLLQRLFDFFASAAPSRDMPGPLGYRDDYVREEWIVTPASGWTFTPLAYVRARRSRCSSDNCSPPARDKSAAAFCRERRMLHRAETDA